MDGGAVTAVERSDNENGEAGGVVAHDPFHASIQPARRLSRAVGGARRNRVVLQVPSLLLTRDTLLESHMPHSCSPRTRKQPLYTS
eukprot:1619066-Prymnesium_polylepis.1